MMTTLESIAASINQIDEKKDNLKKAFNDLQAHRSLLSPSFNLSWSEIDSHFSSLQSSLLNRFRLLQSAAPCPDSERIEAGTADTTETPVQWPESRTFCEKMDGKGLGQDRIDSPDSDRIEAGTAETTEGPVQWPELRTFCEKMDGKGLGKYMIDNSKKHVLINLVLPAAIRCSEDPAALVLDAIESSYHLSPSSSSSANVVHVRRIFVLLLEALIEINANLTNDLRERARTLAYDWKSNIGNKPSEALGFMHLVVAFELASLFSTDELCEYIYLICKYPKATTICKKIGLDRKRIARLIRNFLHTGRLLVAMRFIYENEMTGEFEPIPILKTSLKNTREAAMRVCAEGNYSVKAQSEAIARELKGLRAVIKVIKENNLGFESFEENPEECLKELEDKRAEMRLATKFVSPANHQRPQTHVDYKRPRIANVTTRNYNSTISPLYQQQKLLPDRSQNLQPSPYGLSSSTLPGVAVPYGNPSALFRSGPGPAPASQPVFYDQQTGYGGYRMPPQYHPQPY